MDMALLRSSRLIFDFASCAIFGGEGEVVGSMDDRSATVVRDEHRNIVWTTRTRGGLLRHEKCRVFAVDDREIGYISGWDLCAPDGTVLARVANTHHLNVGTYDVVDNDKRVIARVELSRSEGGRSIRGVPVTFGESHWQLDIADDVGPEVRALIIANVPHWRGKELMALSEADPVSD